MKKSFGLAGLVVAFGLSMFAFAAPTTVRGYIMDSKCANSPNVAKMKGNVQCAQNCVKSGSPAVLVADRSGKVLKIANQDAIQDVVGDHVAVTGTVDGDTITVTKATKVPARKAAAK